MPITVIFQIADYSTVPSFSEGLKRHFMQPLPPFAEDAHTWLPGTGTYISYNVSGFPYCNLIELSVAEATYCEPSRAQLLCTRLMGCPSSVSVCLLHIVNLSHMSVPCLWTFRAVFEPFRLMWPCLLALISPIELIPSKVITPYNLLRIGISLEKL